MNRRLLKWVKATLVCAPMMLGGVALAQSDTGSSGSQPSSTDTTGNVRDTTGMGDTRDGRGASDSKSSADTKSTTDTSDTTSTTTKKKHSKDTKSGAESDTPAPLPPSSNSPSPNY